MAALIAAKKSVTALKARSRRAWTMAHRCSSRSRVFWTSLCFPRMTMARTVQVSGQVCMGEGSDVEARFRPYRVLRGLTGKNEQLSNAIIQIGGRWREALE